MAHILHGESGRSSIRAAISKGRTVIVIAHRLSTVRMADRIIAMDHGQIVEEGCHASLIATPEGYYARLHGLQAA